MKTHEHIWLFFNSPINDYRCKICLLLFDEKNKVCSKCQGEGKYWDDKLKTDVVCEELM